MNDFLQSIRNGNFSKDNRPRYNQQKPRKNYENQNGNYNRGNTNDRKFRQKTDGAASDETLKAIKTALEAIASNQTNNMEIAARRANAEERKAAAFEFIASNFGDFTPAQPEKIETVTAIIKAETKKVVEVPETEKVIETLGTVAVEAAHVEAAPIEAAPVQDKTVQAVPVKSYEIFKNTDSDSEMNKDEVLSMILSMRNDGSTYNEIASHLVSLDLPTFSGRGKWHAQTIHRLCQSI